jgi:hypothetical protein
VSCTRRDGVQVYQWWTANNFFFKRSISAKNAAVEQTICHADHVSQISQNSAVVKPMQDACYFIFFFLTWQSSLGHVKCHRQAGHVLLQEGVETEASTGQTAGNGRRQQSVVPVHGIEYRTVVSSSRRWMGALWGMWR